MPAKKATKTGAVVRHDAPIGTKGVVNELPPRQNASSVEGVLDEIEAAAGQWIELDPAGRQLSSVQSMVSSSAVKRGIRVNVSIRGEGVYARLAPNQAKKGKAAAEAGAEAE